MNPLTKSLRQFKKNFAFNGYTPNWLKNQTNPASTVRMENFLEATKKGRINTRHYLKVSL